MIITIPLRIPSESNIREHWTKRHKRHKEQERAIRLFLQPKAHLFPLPVCIVLIRISPRKLDDDNLVGALKHVRDTIADILIPGLAKGRADGDKRLKFSYSQERGKTGQYFLKIEIQEGNHE